MSAPRWEIRWFDEIDSTNSYLREQARRGAPEGLVAVADHQTAGRGRLDRRWESPPGANLLASVLLRPSCGAQDLHLCTGAMALSALDACLEVAGIEAVLKWPNDLLAGGRKLAGVLAEVEFAGEAVAAVVIGIGLNVGWPGPEGAMGTSLDQLRDGAPPLQRQTLLEQLLAALAARRPMLDDATGRGALAAEVRARCATVGQHVRVALADGELTGLATSIDDDGQLVVETEHGLRRIAAGDVVHLRQAPGAEPI